MRSGRLKKTIISHVPRPCRWQGEPGAMGASRPALEFLSHSPVSSNLEDKLKARVPAVGGSGVGSRARDFMSMDFPSAPPCKCGYILELRAESADVRPRSSPGAREPEQPGYKVQVRAQETNNSGTQPTLRREVSHRDLVKRRRFGFELRPCPLFGFRRQPLRRKKTMSSLQVRTRSTKTEYHRRAGWD